MRKKKRFISFDLSTQMLKQYYPGKDHHQAYKDIQKYMKDHGFDHSEWSGYFSKKAMTKAEITDYVTEMLNYFPWLDSCINHFHVTNKSDFDIAKVIQARKENVERTQETKALSEKSKPKRIPIREALAKAQKEVDEYNASLGIRPISKDDLEL